MCALPFVLQITLSYLITPLWKIIYSMRMFPNGLVAVGDSCFSLILANYDRFLCVLSFMLGVPSDGWLPARHTVYLRPGSNLHIPNASGQIRYPQSYHGHRFLLPYSFTDSSTSSKLVIAISETEYESLELQTVLQRPKSIIFIAATGIAVVIVPCIQYVYRLLSFCYWLC